MELFGVLCVCVAEGSRYFSGQGQNVDHYSPLLVLSAELGGSKPVQAELEVQEERVAQLEEALERAQLEDDYGSSSDIYTTMGLRNIALSSQHVGGAAVANKLEDLSARNAELSMRSVEVARRSAELRAELDASEAKAADLSADLAEVSFEPSSSIRVVINFDRVVFSIDNFLPCMISS